MSSHTEDTFEPVNRATWAVNRFAIVNAVEPATTAYVVAVPKPVRKSIGNMRTNLSGPVRITNQILQGRWADSGQESLRFLTNTTVGIGGLFDVAKHANLPGSQASFNQTFRKWGWQPSTYIMLPALGPSDNVAAPARLFEVASDPTLYLGKLQVVGHITRFDQISEITGNSAYLMRTEADSYDLVRKAWPYFARAEAPDWTPQGPPDIPTLQTLAAAKYQAQDPAFLLKSKNLKAKIPATGRKLPFQLWLQKNAAPIVYLVPGIGSHRSSGNTLTLAERFIAEGFSVVTISGVFHPEFMENASSSRMPGDPERDSADVLAACSAIDSLITSKYKNRFTKRVLAGFSLGGFDALQIAASKSSHPKGSINFDHFLAIQTPVDLSQAYRTLDGFFATQQKWPASERAKRIDHMFHKVAALITQGLPPDAVTPFDGYESKVLVGYSFRRVLRDSLFSIHRRYPSSNISMPASTWRREPLYEQLMGVSFEDYFEKWLIPEENRKGSSRVNLSNKISLRRIENSLRNHPKIHVISNRNDFLLTPGDSSWLTSTFGKRAVWLPSGGHLGNLGDPVFLDALSQILNTIR